MKPQISTIICTHNPSRAILARTLDALRGQTLSQDEWELLIVDSKSDEALQDWLDVGWHTDARIVRENVIGKTRAVYRGIQETQGDLILLVDDDNFLEPEYMAKALQIARQWPMIGAWGGRILPEFERTPPEWTRRYWSYLTILDCPYDRWSNVADHFEAVPPGAGLVVRRQVAKTYAELVNSDPMRMALDRTGKALISGGDTDLAFTACDLGFGIARFSSLELRHYMPAWRFEESYLLRMVEGMAYSLQMLTAIRGNPTASTNFRQRGWRYLAGWKLRARDRRFWHSQLRGQRRAEKVIAQNPQLEKPKDVRRVAGDTAARFGLDSTSDSHAACCNGDHTK
jgi:glycosyltransferase involved in cell wall biosynthesis